MGVYNLNNRNLLCRLYRKRYAEWEWWL